MIETDFSAKEPALGYYYQIRYSLYLLLKQRENDDIELALEQLDDIVIEDVNSAKTNLFQTKLHIKSVANLTNASPDLWKTIRVWSDSVIKKHVDPTKTLFTLITTAKASESAITHELCKPSGIRDNEEILKILEETSQLSKSDTNEKAYTAFHQLTTAQKKALIEHIHILDASLDIEQVKQKTLDELKLSTTPDKLVPFYERLEGWWFQRCILNLFQDMANITFHEVQGKIYDIQDHFRTDNLPIDFIETIQIGDQEAEEDHRIFVQQLRLIVLGKSLIKNAISDYYRAIEQRSKWVREGLVNPDEETRYEAELIGYWEPKFALMKDDVEASGDVTEEEYHQLGKSFYTNYYIKTCPQKYFRERVTSEFLARGSSHFLADRKMIGWHPYYAERLENEL
ncbi:MAG: hypothetical protein JW943_03955 [Deltaproteobacteria bacterium]|nr:hypothetical protein [Deltaproteobacteria bacterium]